MLFLQAEKYLDVCILIRKTNIGLDLVLYMERIIDDLSQIRLPFMFMLNYLSTSLSLSSYLVAYCKHALMSHSIVHSLRLYIVALEHTYRVISSTKL